MQNKTNSSYIDISLIRNQHNNAIILADIFELSELEQLIILLKDNFICSEKRKITENSVVFLIDENIGNKNIKILDIINIDDYHKRRYTRFIDIRISINENIQIDFKLKHIKKIKSCMLKVVASAINFTKYKNPCDRIIIKNNIINNFSKTLANDLDIETLEETKVITDFINLEQDIIEKDSYNFDFSLDEINFNINTNMDLIKFCYIKNNISNYIYLSKNRIGVSTISLIIEKALKIKTR